MCHWSYRVDHGYVKIKYDAKGNGICGINLMASYPVF